MPGGSDAWPVALPAHLQRIFWDTALADIDPEVHRAFVIERVLEYGDAESVRWLWQRYGPEPIRDVVRSSHRLSARTRSLWGRHLGLGEMQEWSSARAQFPPTSWRR